jgi:hypothetical protein
LQSVGCLAVLAVLVVVLLLVLRVMVVVRDSSDGSVINSTIVSCEGTDTFVLIRAQGR